MVLKPPPGKASASGVADCAASTSSYGRPRSPAPTTQRRASGQSISHRGAIHLGGEIAGGEQHLGAGVGEQVGDLRPLQPVADRHQLSAQHADGVEQLEPLAAVVQRCADGVADAHPRRAQRARQPVHPRRELAVGAPLLADDQRRLVRPRPRVMREPERVRIDGHGVWICQRPPVAVERRTHAAAV